MCIKSNMTIFSLKNILDPSFLSQIVADVETRRYSVFLLPAINQKLHQTTAQSQAEGAESRTDTWHSR